MRYLHAIAPHERFVASGIYRYFHDNHILSTTEEWSIHELPDGERFIRIDHDAKPLMILTEALMRSDGSIERVDMQCFAGRSVIRTTWVRHDDYIQVGRRFNYDERTYNELPIEKDTLLCPPFLLLEGYCYALFAHHAERLIVTTRLDIEGIGIPFVTYCQVKDEGTQLITIGQRDIIGRRLQVNEHPEWIWLDDKGIALKWSALEKHGQQFTKYLSNYAHR